MILSSRMSGNPPPQAVEMLLAMTEGEFNQAIKGKVVKHPTASRDISGIWEVRFKKNSLKKHKEFYG